MIRTILSPGVELNEVDKSQYIPTTTDTFKVLVPGFSSKGKTTLPTSITSLNQFKDMFGAPTNEAEYYAFNSVSTLLGDGAEVVFGRLPYSDVKYPVVEYTIDADTAEISEISGLTALTETTAFTTEKYREISASVVKLIDDTVYNDLPTPTDTTGPTKLHLVDITRSAYSSTVVGTSKQKCLGIMPVVTTAINALAVQGAIDDVNMFSTTFTEGNASYEALSGNAEYLIDDDNTTAKLSADNIWAVPPAILEKQFTDSSLAIEAARTFPHIHTTTDSKLLTTYNNYIGVVVYQIEADSNNDLIARPVEAYAGSVVKDAVDSNTNASTYIGDIINSQSGRIRLYESGTELTTDNVDDDSILYAQPAVPYILGTLNSGKIKYSELTKGLDTILDQQSNALSTVLDVVIDGGLSTIAEYIHGGNGDAAKQFTPNTADGSSLKDCAQWRAIVEKLKAFCQTTRKDCVFITETPRQFSIEGRNKIVGSGDPPKTVDDTLMPKLTAVNGINSSYGWGYAVWFKIADAHSGTAFWMPPSAFGAAAYIRTRRNFNVWDAPAGITRGAISVADTSFEPGLQARNKLYSNNWNYSLTYVNQGTVLEGQKTFQTKTSAFDRINVRSLFLYLERRVLNIARNFVYETNTAYNQQQFYDSIAPMFDAVKAAGGIYDYKIIADETINTGDLIDNNTLYCKIGLKPSKTIEFVIVDFIATRTDASFSEVL